MVNIFILDVLTVLLLSSPSGLGRRNYQPPSISPPRFLLNERSTLCIPFVNVDGYLFNEKSRSKMKRKNGRPTCPRNHEDGGVDLNRNFARAWQRVANGCSEEYGGTEPFSEPETQALKALVLGERRITVIANLHSYGSMLTHPYNSERGSNIIPKVGIGLG